MWFIQQLLPVYGYSRLADLTLTGSLPWTYSPAIPVSYTLILSHLSI